MDHWYVGAALLSAILHAVWNAVVKQSTEPRAVMTGQMVTCAYLVVPILVYTGLPAMASWPWIACATTINIVTITALLHAYENAGFGLAYPLARAISVMCVVPFAAIVAGESLTAYGFAGVAMVAIALGLIAFSNIQNGVVPFAAFGWIALSGFGTALAVMCEAQGVRRSGSPLAYGSLAAITNAAAMLWWRSELTSPIRAVTRYASQTLPIAVMSMTSYVLILWVWNGAKIASSAALRDTSAFFAIIIAIVWLKEPITPLRVAALMLAAAAIPILRYA